MANPVSGRGKEKQLIWIKISTTTKKKIKQKGIIDMAHNKQTPCTKSQI